MSAPSRAAIAMVALGLLLLPAGALAQERRPAEPVPWPPAPADTSFVPPSDFEVVETPPVAEAVAEEDAGRWLFEPLGTWGFTVEHYNRVDGLTPAWGFALEPTDPMRTPEISARVARATTHDRWYWKGSLRQRLPLPGALVVRGDVFHHVTTFDDWKMTTRENDFTSFVTASDQLDWWRERGLFVALDAETSGGRLGGTLGYFRVRQWSARNRTPFTLLGGDPDWRDNPPIEAGRLRSLVVEAWLDTRDVQSPLLPAPGWIVRWTWEGAGGTLGGDIDFSRGSLDVRRYTRIGRDAWWDSRIVWKGPFGDDNLPAQREVRLGGPGSLRGFRASSFIGDQGLQGQTELRLPLPVNDEIAVLFLSWHWVGFFDVGRIAVEDEWGNWHADMGTGISGINIFSYVGVFVAWRVTDMSGSGDDPRFIVRLRRDF